jgi:hypothetical protein
VRQGTATCKSKDEDSSPKSLPSSEEEKFSVLKEACRLTEEWVLTAPWIISSGASPKRRNPSPQEFFTSGETFAGSCGVETGEGGAGVAAESTRTLSNEPETRSEARRDTSMDKN